MWRTGGIHTQVELRCHPPHTHPESLNTARFKRNAEEGLANAIQQTGSVQALPTIYQHFLAHLNGCNIPGQKIGYLRACLARQMLQVDPIVLFAVGLRA